MMQAAGAVGELTMKMIPEPDDDIERRIGEMMSAYYFLGTCAREDEGDIGRKMPGFMM
jgi:hypothetical protein